MRSGTLRNKCSRSNAATMHGLNKWYMAMFEELGWMVLANKKGMDEKIKHYKTSLHNLETHLECKIKSVRDYDKKTDLQILLENVKILIAHVDKDF